WPNTAVYKYYCNNCGEYLASDVFTMTWQEVSPEDKSRISSYLQSRYLSKNLPIAFETKGSTTPQTGFNGIPFVTVEEILDQFPKTYTEKFNKALFNLEKLTNYLGDPISIRGHNHPIFYAVNFKEMDEIVKYLEEMGYIRKIIRQEGILWDIVLTPKGFEQIYELKKTKIDSKQAFVAMCFEPTIVTKYDLDNVYKNGFKNAIKKSGYDPLLIKNEEYIGKIDDEIIAGIRRSKFLVADFTGHRQSVYFEAGYAHGLDIKVIYTCHQDEIDDAHFDTEHYNHIVWGTPEELSKKLLNRIRATIL
ncbi:hypothetical protein LCGC14_3164990, partial [marine sediment metagenome]